MQFYRLWEPPFPFDARGRAVERSQPFTGMPGVDCRTCCQVWSRSGYRIRQELPESHWLHNSRGWPVDTQTLAEIREEVREALNLSANFPLPPGTNIGFLPVKIKRNHILDFEWPDFASVIVSDKAIRAFREANLRGWSVSPVNIVKNSKIPVGELFELIVNGHAGKAVTNPVLQAKSVCADCGRVEYEKYDCTTAQVNEQEWDGTDFSHFDDPCQGYKIVTQRVVDTVQAFGLTNVGFQPLPLSDCLEENELAF